MQTTALEPIGLEVTDLDLRTASADPELVATFRKVLAEHGVVVVRDQSLDDDEFTDFLRAFGDLVFTEGETPVDGHPDLNVVTNVGRTTAPRSVFHVDTSYLTLPPSYTALRAVTVPEQGGQTLFTNQYAAYETLPAGLKVLAEGRSLRHLVTGVSPGSQQTEAWHPIFRPHPLTGRLSLYLSTPERCVEVEGLNTPTGAELVRRLYEHSTASRNVLAHVWAPGDVVIWDNACVLHKADHSGVVGDRVMHRGMIAGSDPSHAA